jgi:subtilisin family serine protease
VRRKLLIALAALATTLATAIPAGAGPVEITAQTDNTEAPYVVVMEAAPVLGNDDIAPAGEEPPDPESAAVEEYAAELEAEKVDALSAAGISQDALVATFGYAVNGFSAALTAAEAERLAAQKGVLLVQRDELHQLHTSDSPEFLGLDDRRGAWDSGLTGAGVVIGVIDTGIWPEHPSFAPRSDLGPAPITIEDRDVDPNPAVERFSLGCDFGNTTHNENDADFPCNNKLIGARDMRFVYKQVIGTETYASARDYEGHGSHTASTAAGNPHVDAAIFGREFGEVSGIAPDAHIVAYSACGNLGCFGGDLALAIDTAVEDGVDVINYSIGGATPGLTGTDDIAFLFAANAGVFVATSAGNAGPGTSTVGSPASVPWVTTVGASLQKKTYIAEARTSESEHGSRWSRWFKRDQGVYEGASITPGTAGQLPFVDAANHGNELCDPAVDFTGDLTGTVVLCLRGGPARVEKSRAVFEAGGLGMVLYNLDDVQDLLTDNHVVASVNVSFSDGIAMKQYIADSGAGATVEITDGEEKRQRGNTMAAFSSRGPVGSPASDDIIKPDVTAPGVQILAGNSQTTTLGAQGELFQSISGTSMSSPHVAGLLALLKQAHPDWSAAMAKSALMTTARQDVRKEDGETRADPFDFGAGHVDPSGRASADGSLFNPGLVYDADIWDYFGFLCEAAPEIFVSPAATCALVEPQGGSTIATNLNYPSIAVSEVPGTKTVTRTVTNVSDETGRYRVQVDEPRGYDVTVTPDRITLAPGEFATFEVTFVNQDAPVGEWRFGSLTWHDGRYRVRSPIAVNASAIEVPDSVSGSGSNGSVNIPVAFGYTGAYTATPHGMFADTLVEGSVTQDPNQSFAPSDVGNGATAHEIVVGNSGYLRLSVTNDDTSPIDPRIDLDLYLFGPGGTQVASSGSEFTDELIELHLPGAGTYTLFVHGWDIRTNPSINYAIHRWDVPLDVGATSLAVGPGPPSATIGTTGEVTATWNGLEAGRLYFGGVTHSNGTDTLGFTLVEVDAGS